MSNYDELRSPEKGDVTTEQGIEAALDTWIEGQGKLHDYLCKVAVNWLLNMGCMIAVDEITTYATSERCDAIGFSGAHAVVVEVKTSRADFFRDAKKHHKITNNAMGNYRYYMTLKGLISVEELPEGWGLIEVENGRCSVKAGHKKISPWYDEHPFPISNTRGEIGLLCSLVRRLRDADPSACKIKTAKMKRKTPDQGCSV